MDFFFIYKTKKQGIKKTFLVAIGVRIGTAVLGWYTENFHVVKLLQKLTLDL